MKKEIKFGPAGLGPIKSAEDMLESYAQKGFKACEIAFTYSVYIKDKKDAERIGAKAKELGISLSIHGQYFINLNSAEKDKIEASKKRILHCCEIGESLGATRVVFHPGYYTKNKSSLSRKLPKAKAKLSHQGDEVSDGKDSREETYTNIKKQIILLMGELKKRKYKIKLAPETMGRVNVFGSVEEISSLVKDTGCDFCIDFAHILARDKKVDYKKVKKLFPAKEWHVHFSGIEYGEKGEKRHKPTGTKEWKELLKNLPRDKDIVIVNESPSMVQDSFEGLKLWKKIR